MRHINEIIVHCTATEKGVPFSVADIDRWHKQKGWKGIGYHYVIYLDGTVHEGRPAWSVGAHCIGHNAHSIGICYIGGLGHPLKGDAKGKPEDTRTPEQKAALEELLKQLHKCYPSATIHGHNEFANKACPCFDVQKEYGTL